MLSYTFLSTYRNSKVLLKSAIDVKGQICERTELLDKAELNRIFCPALSIPRNSTAKAHLVISEPFPHPHYPISPPPSPKEQ